MNILEVKGLHKSFGDRQVLNGCSLKVGEGRIIGLLGPSGAGKSTLLRCIAGLLRPEWGTIRLRGEEIRPKDRPRIAYLADHTLLPGTPVPIIWTSFPPPTGSGCGERWSAITSRGSGGSGTSPGERRNSWNCSSCSSGRPSSICWMSRWAAWTR